MTSGFHFQRFPSQSKVAIRIQMPKLFPGSPRILCRANSLPTAMLIRYGRKAEVLNSAVKSNGILPTAHDPNKARSKLQ